MKGKNLKNHSFLALPGANCSIFGCRTSRKHVGVAIFRIPAETDKLSKKTRKAWISIITKDRIVDNSLRRQIESGNLYVCKKHFKNEEYDCRKCILFFYYLILRMKQQNAFFTIIYMRRYSQTIDLCLLYANWIHFHFKLQ